MENLIYRCGLRGCTRDLKEVAFTLYSTALAEKERLSCPRVGLATDRRTLGHMGEVFFEDNVKVLICFVCGCKHLNHEGVDKFGQPHDKGTISYLNNLRPLLESVDGTAGRENLSRKYYKDRFGGATAAAPDLEEGCLEWVRTIRLSRGDEELLCCPEDVLKSAKCSAECRRRDDYVCPGCKVPVCRECHRLSELNRQIPKALANDNFIGYVHRFIVENQVTWLEATIASPVFSGLVTYYIEGKPSERHHMMESAVGKPERAWGVRGNLFSFLLPWETIMVQLFKKIEEGDLSEWPLDRFTAARVVRVRLVRGPEQIVKKLPELRVRSWVVRKLAHIYIERHIGDLRDRPGVLKIHSAMADAGQQFRTVEESLKEHVNSRVKDNYPPEEYDTATGHVLPELLEMARAQTKADGTTNLGSAFEMKQTAMPDIPVQESSLFENLRPSIVTDEATTSNTLHEEVLAEHALKSVSSLTVKMSNEFENQFVSKYTPRIFPWALNYDCGGAEYPNLFTDWDELLRGEEACVAESISQRWRKIHGEAPLLPGDYASMLSTRVETQVAGDWMVVPAARNLHWRYAVLHSAFITCKQKVAPGETLNQNLIDLIDATKKVWERMAANSVVIKGIKKNINGNVSILFAADDISSTEKYLAILFKYNRLHRRLSANSQENRCVLLWFSCGLR